jgi:hypothetical protein
VLTMPARVTCSREQGCRRGRVEAAGRLAGNGEALEAKGVGQLGHVERPVRQTAPGLDVGAADARTVGGDEVHADSLRRVHIRAPEPRQQRAVGRRGQAGRAGRPTRCTRECARPGAAPVRR